MEKYTFPTTPKANPKAIIQGPTYRFTLLTDRLIRYEWAGDGQFEDRASTFAIHRDFPLPEFRSVDGGDLEVITEHFHMSYSKQKFSPESLVFHFSGKSVKYGTPWRFGTPTEFNLGGTARTLDQCDGRCDMGQGILSKAGYAVIDDSKSILFDGKGFVAARKPGDRFDGYLFCYGRDYRAAMSDFYHLSGRQPVLPRYVFGNWWSRYYAYHQDEYTQLMDKFRSKDIPLSVAVVDMDWHYVSDERVPHAGWTGYTWNPKLFPDPKRFGREIHERKLKITLNDHPHSGVHAHEDAYEEMARFLGHDTKDKNPILFDPTSPKFMEAYLGILHRRLEKQACDFWWIDWQQGPYSKVPGFDPLWLLNHFQYLDSGLDGKNPLVFSRYGGPGSHRYPVGFSGDTVVSWTSLEFQPEFTATASNIGYGWWSHDIGGHIHGCRDDELFTRWTQLGVFSPIMRLHSTTSPWMSKEPWLYSKECEAVVSAFLRFRHRLIPYLYTENLSGVARAQPLVQPMYWSYPNSEQAYEFPNQYLFGPELLVAPIVRPRDQRTSMASVKAWLPTHTRYVDIFTGTVYDGDRSITLHRHLHEYPVLARQGSIIPLDGDAVPQNGGLNPDSVEVLVIVGKDYTTSMKEDPQNDIFQDNEARTVDSQIRTMRFSFDQQLGKLTADVKRRQWSFRFPGIASRPPDLKVLVDGLDRTAEAIVFLESYPKASSLLVKCPSASRDQYSIVVELGRDPQLSVVDHTPRLRQLIMQFQIEFKAKDKLWNAVDGYQRRPINATIGTLLSLGYDEAIVGPIIELISADSRGAAQVI